MCNRFVEGDKMNHKAILAVIGLSSLLFAIGSRGVPNTSTASTAAKPRVVAYQASAAPAPMKPARCATPEYRQLDFWVGDWDAFDADKPDTQIARTHVTPMVGGCALREVYEQNDGLLGESFSAYEGGSGQWRHSWVSNHGGVMVLEGHFATGEMAMSGEDRSGAKPRLIRDVWTKSRDGVREAATVSTDGGKTWQPLFDVLFRPHREAKR
jgi:hypothetical protein